MNRILNRVINVLKKKKVEVGSEINPFDYYLKNDKIGESDFKKPILTKDKSNELLYNHLMSEAPLMVTRFGNGELLFLSNYLSKKILGYPNWHPYVLHRAFRLNAIWPHSGEAIANFAETYLNAIPAIDVLGVWFNRGEDIVSNYLNPKADLVPLISLESYLFNKPWTRALKDRKVLVIHPYSKSITLQFRKKEELFGEKNVLPDFELITYKPVNVYTDDISSFPSWEAALAKMKNDIEQLSFDVAMIAAGPFGLPLASHVKEMGKQSLHIGGALQLYFGIKGRRWEDREQSKLFNEHWVYPSDEETPNDEVRKKVDDSSYWK